MTLNPWEQNELISSNVERRLALEYLQEFAVTVPISTLQEMIDDRRSKLGKSPWPPEYVRDANDRQECLKEIAAFFSYDEIQQSFPRT